MIVLIGHGWVGSAIAAELQRREIPFTWYHHEETWWAPLEPELVINAAGFTGVPNIDACEDAKKETIVGNILWPLECERRTTAPVLHIGSGCVYNGGDPWVGYTEDDPPNFEGSFYSLTKSLVQARLHRGWVLRARMPFSRQEHPKNLLTKLKRYPVLVDAVNSLTCLEDLAEIVAHFIEHRPPFGTYNCVNSGWVHTTELVSRLGLTKQWFRDQAEFEATVKAPRSSCVLSVKKLAAVYPRLRTLGAALDDCIPHLKQQKAA